jgi:predicted nucleotidyltransferase
MKTIDEIKSVLQSEKEELTRLGITEIGVFGSYVRGEAAIESDIDILIDISPNSSLTLLSLIELEQSLSERLNTKVDLAIKGDLKPNIGKQILSEVVYV